MACFLVINEWNKKNGISSKFIAVESAGLHVFNLTLADFNGTIKSSYFQFPN